MSTNWLVPFDLGTGTGKSAPARAKLVHRVPFTLCLTIFTLAIGWLGTAFISPVNAQDVTYFRIATGGPGSQSFEIAGNIGKAISNPVVTSECDPGDNCGVPGIVGMAQTTSGAMESLKLLSEGQVDGAIVQADMAAMAAAGKGPFKSIGANSSIRAIATVGDTALQIIVPQRSDLHDLLDLKGRRIVVSSTDADGVISANLVLTQLGIVSRKTKLTSLPLVDAKQQLIADKVEALVIMDRRNLPEVMAISDHMPIRLLSITETEFKKIGTTRRDYLLAHLPAGIDGSATPADTLVVPILFVVSAKEDDKIALDLAKALVMPKRGVKTTANPAASAPDAHIESTVIPLHPGVERLLQTTN